jgi:acyl-CoA synthetase (AMP-forming)/AMP-acid ligase II
VLRDGALFTGDLATVDDDGFLYIVSRKKDMIKSGANRISPREIEDVVCQMPGILESAALGVPDEILGETITLFVVKTDGAALSEKDIMIFCRQNLALYKNPKRVVFVASLPKTASGKVKREELRTRT